MAIQIQIKRGVLANRPTLAAGEFYFATDTQQLYLGTSGSPLLINGAGSTINKGTAVLDFGSFPGKSDTSIAVTGQTNILAGSTLTAWLFPAASADHTADEHLIEDIRVFAGNIVAGTGFTIYGIHGGFVGTEATLTYGQWNVAWMWS